MKSFKAMMAEVAQPESEEEKAFKAQHKVVVGKHPVALDHQHTGEIAKPKAKRKADQEGDAAYDMAYESVKQLDENPQEEIPMMMNQLAFICYAAEEMSGMMKLGGDPEEWFQNKLAAAHAEMKSLYSYMQGENQMGESTMAKRDALDKSSAPSKEGKKAVTLKKAPWDKNEELSPAQKKIDHNKNGKIDGHDLAMIRAKKKDEACSTSKKSYKEEVDLEEAHSTWEVSFKSDGHKPQQVKARNTSEAIKKASKKAQAMHAQPKQIPMHKAVKKVSEEVEQIDELSNDTLRNYHGAAALDLRKKREKLDKGTLTTKDHKQGQNRVTGLNRAANKMEEVEQIDEAFKAGIVKLKDNSSMVLKKEDADTLNKLFKNMSSGSVKKMTETAMKDKAGFAEILSFAKEAM